MTDKERNYIGYILDLNHIKKQQSLRLNNVFAPELVPTTQIRVLLDTDDSEYGAYIDFTYHDFKERIMYTLIPLTLRDKRLEKLTETGEQTANALLQLAQGTNNSLISVNKRLDDLYTAMVKLIQRVPNYWSTDEPKS